MRLDRRMKKEMSRKKAVWEDFLIPFHLPAHNFFPFCALRISNVLYSVAQMRAFYYNKLREMKTNTLREAESNKNVKYKEPRYTRSYAVRTHAPEIERERRVEKAIYLSTTKKFSISHKHHFNLKTILPCIFFIARKGGAVIPST